MIIDLSGQVAVITGAAQGIGESTARQLARSGARVLIADIKAEQGEVVAGSINAEGGQAKFVTADVSEDSQIQGMIETAVKEFGRLDILVNNAHFEVHGSATEISADDWDRSHAVLLRALFLGTKYAVPHMRSVGGGSIINISSVLGRQPPQRYITYTTAKAAVVQMTRQIALDYGPDGIRANTITPGAIHKRPGDAGGPERQSVAARVTPVRRTGIPRDIAAAICFLVSDHASFITGADLVIDGGLTIPFFSEFQKRLNEISTEE